MKNRQFKLSSIITPVATWIPLTIVTLWFGCNSVADIRTGNPYPDACTTVEDCIKGAPQCRTTTCENERCVYIDAAEGTPLPDAEQATGDCVEIQCDGAGFTRIAPVAADVPDDGNPCTNDECVGTQPTHVNLASIPCYSGPIGTDLFGNCRGGIQLCENGQPIGACLGERIPRLETCLTIFDDDCDGSVNEEGEGCVCSPGSIGTCYPGVQESLGNGACAVGQQVCNVLGTAYDECMGFVGPSIEVCDAAQSDEDCDGLKNEDGENCTCGDGFVSGNETCDDGNLSDGDSCSAQCKIPNCGNGQPDAGEECDDGNSDNTDACTTKCKNAVCGDGFIQTKVEQCDDNNTIDSDACTNTCTANVVEESPFLEDCQAILARVPNAASGVYTIDPDLIGPGEPFLVNCDMTTAGGGWTVVEKSPFDSPIDQSLYDDVAVNVTMPNATAHRLSRSHVDKILAVSTEMRLDCRGNDHLLTASSNFYAGEGKGVTCSNFTSIPYIAASLKGYTLTNTNLCTWTAPKCGGIWHIDEGSQSLCMLPNQPWKGDGTAIGPMSADHFSMRPATADSAHDCHKPGAVRFIMLR